jgi:hypothetical protein
MNHGQWQLQVFSLPGKELASYGINITELNSDGTSFQATPQGGWCGHIQIIR